MSRFVYFVIPIFVIGSLISCDKGDDELTVKWINDGTVLEIDKGLKKGDIPHYDGPTPTRADSYPYTYSFKGWNIPIEPIYENKTYYANYQQDYMAPLSVFNIYYTGVYPTYSFRYEGTLDEVDWGDGTVDKLSSHKYAEEKGYRIIAKGSNGFVAYSSGNQGVDLQIIYAKVAGTTNHLPDEAFASCCCLGSIDIPNSITSIGKYAFFNTTFSSIDIPDSVTEIDEGAFESTWFKSIELPNSITKLSPKLFFSSNMTSFTIPNSITEIGHEALFGCSNLTTIKIPNSVTSIEYDAFKRCGSLTDVYIPNSVITMGKDVFTMCNKSLKIRCGAPSKPAGWDDEWAGNCKNITWGASI